MCLTLGDMAIQMQSWGLNIGLLRAQWLTYLCCTECNLALPLFLSISFFCVSASCCHGNQLHMLIARQNSTSSVFPNFCFLLCPQQKSSTMWTPTHTWKIQELTFSGKTLTHGIRSWWVNISHSLFSCLGWKHLRYVLYSFSDGAQVGWSPGIPSGTQLSNAPLSWLSLISFTHSVPWGGGRSKMHSSISHRDFQTSHLSPHSAQIWRIGLEEGLVPGLSHIQCSFCLFPSPHGG